MADRVNGTGIRMEHRRSRLFEIMSHEDGRETIYEISRMKSQDRRFILIAVWQVNRDVPHRFFPVVVHDHYIIVPGQTERGKVVFGSRSLSYGTGHGTWDTQPAAVWRFNWTVHPWP